MNPGQPGKSPQKGEMGAFDAYSNDIFAGMDGAAGGGGDAAYPGSETIYASTDGGQPNKDRSAWDKPVVKAASSPAWTAPQAKPTEQIQFTDSTADPRTPSATGREARAAQSSSNAPAPSGPAPWYTLRAYSCYFDVDTKEVGQRMLASLMFSRDFFLEVEAKPDLYGPFWIATTSIFLMAMVAAELSWLHHKSSDKEWSFDAEKVGTCAAIFYGYVFVIGGLLYFHLAILNRAQIGLFSLWCIYGYSMTIWIPVTLLSTIPVQSLSWILVCVATLYSAIFLVLNLRQAVQESLSTSAQQGVTLLLVFLFHLGSGLLLKLMVFTYRFDSDPSPPPPAPPLPFPPASG